MAKNEAGMVIIDGVEYVPRSSVSKSAAREGKPYVMVRTTSAGVFAGYLDSRDGREVVLLDARRMWYWTGAASLSQLATDGPSSTATCKFPCAVDSITLTEAIEIIPITEKACAAIAAVPVWKQ